jgi:hypothetical protein
MTMHRGGIPFLSVILICCSPLFLGATENQQAPNSESDKAVWAWADRVGNDNVIFISRKVGGVWTSPETISEQGGINVVPAVSSSGNGDDLFTVWTNHNNSQAQLRYRQLKAGAWTEEQEFYSGLVSNTAPTLADDASGTLWMVWAGYNGISDEIYYSRWNGSSFDSARAITANDVPDILPVLGIDEQSGLPWIQWLQYTESGYRKFETSWNGSSWSVPIGVESQDSPASTATSGSTTQKARATLPTKKVGDSGANATNNTEEGGEVVIEIPAFVTMPESASVHIPGYSVRSLPVRSMSAAK